ncbi:MAG: hypothetical protein ABL994_21060, partial [Verrucomicrobiales bacterium]
MDAVDVDTFSSGLTYGTDGDGVNDRAEGNIAIGMSLALGLELDGARVSGNRFNVFPDGKTFLDITEYALAQNLESMEVFENGRSRQNTLIGTDGNGVSDADERNVMGPVKYGHLFENYGGNPGANFVIAGNFCSVGVDGATVYPFEPVGAPDFFDMDGAGSVRIGSNGDGVSDDLEANFIQSTAGARFCDTGLDVAIVARGNVMRGNGFLAFPFRNLDNGRDYAKYYTNALAGPLDTETSALPTLGDVADGFLTGTVPAPNLDNYPFSVVDLYLRDLSAAADQGVIPSTRIGTFVEGSTQDSAPAPGEFRFPVRHLNIPAGSEVIAVVTYSKVPNSFEASSALTGPASASLPVSEVQPEAVVSPTLSLTR